MRLYLTSLIYFFSLCILLAMTEDGQSAPHHNENQRTTVLLLNSYDQEMNWVKGITNGVLETLASEEEELFVQIENMDSKLFSSDDYFESYAAYLKEKYKNTSFSVILASDNNATYLLRTYRDSLFPGVPVVFCGVNQFELKYLADLDKFTGVEEKISFKKTIDLIVEAHPETTEIFVINDYLTTGRSWVNNINTIIKDLPDNVNVTHSENLSLGELKNEIAQLPHGTIVVLGAFFADREGYSSTYEEIGKDLAQNSSVPVYCLTEFNVTEHIIGGIVLSGYSEGAGIARIALRILKGEDPNTIPINSKGNNRGIFNYTQLNRFGIKESLLPENSLILNRPFSFYTTYKTRIWINTLFIVILLSVIALLCINIIQRRKAERTLLESEKRFRILYDNAPVMLHSIDLQSRILQVNNIWLRTLGYRREEVIGTESSQFFPLESQEKVHKNFPDLLSQGVLHDSFYQLVKKNGDTIDVLLSAHVEKDTTGAIIGARAACIDVTELKSIQEEKETLEIQLMQAQKLESIGRLAGGVAHDLNNLLSPILGYGELLNLDPTLSKDQKKKVEQINKAGGGARDLVQQLLAFSRKQALKFSSIDLNQTLKNYQHLLNHTIREDITIVLKLAPEIKPVLADMGQIEQMIMNLVVNASDAMSEGGQLILETAPIYLDEEYCSKNQDAVPGYYSAIRVKDNGTGMTEEIQEMIFEPFFSTKGELGTGLGLSTVYGIVKQHNGSISVDTKPNTGTTFTAYFPVANHEADTVIENASPSRDLMGSKRILLVEDNTQVRNVALNILENFGYDVITAHNGTKALELIETETEAIHLLLTDVVMPDMNGKELYLKILESLPDIRVAYMSGYANNIINQHGVIDEDVIFIQKPFTTQFLAEKIKEALM